MDRTLPVPAPRGAQKDAVPAPRKFESALTDWGRGPFPNEPRRVKQQAFPSPGPARPVPPLGTHHPLLGHQQQPGQDAARGAKEAAPRCKSITPCSFRPQGQKSAREGKEAGGKGVGNSGGWLARPVPGLGKVTLAAKVEQVLLSPSPTGDTSALPAGTTGPVPRGSVRGRRKAPRWPGTSVSLGFYWSRGAGGSQRGRR